MLLGLDLGTTNVKAILAEADGRVISRASVPVRMLHVGADGLEQDIGEIRSAALQALREATGRTDASAVAAVGVSSQGGALQMMDPEGGPLGRVISWMDGRAAPYGQQITARLGVEWFLSRVGHGSGGLAVGQILRLRSEQPGLFDRPYRVGFVGDAVVQELCGRGAHDGTSLSLALMYNPSLRTADPDLLRELGLAEAHLPDLLSPTESAGGLRAEAAARTSLPAGIPVSPAVHDQYAAALGCGAVSAGDVMFGAGTAWVLLAVSDRLVRPVIPAAFVCTHLVEGLYGQILSLVNGGSCFAWAAGLLGLAGKSTGEIDDILHGVPAGSEGLRFRPLLAPGGGAGLASGTAGGLDGLRLSHGAGHILRAVVEGLAFELARYLRMLTGAGIPVERLVMCGGAAAGRVTPQIVADVAGLPLACCTEADTSAFGAVVLARGLLERDTGLAALSRQMAPSARMVEPGPDAPFYRELLERYVESLPVLGERDRP